ncbi:hypothetical protein [Serratia marcescens]|uniref:hypothetical protein n=1 Tax=Serratia marcescens TaxID=615 RepID=UPI00313ECFB2
MRIIDLNGNGAERFDNPDKVLQDEALDQLNAIIQAQISSLEAPPLYTADRERAKLHSPP